jgi:hypothetical protein
VSVTSDLWEVSRIGGSSTTFIGSVYAVDENEALKPAIAELKIRPAHPWRLSVRKA